MSSRRLTKARAAKADRTISKLDMQTAALHRDMQEFGRNAKGGDASAIVPISKALGDARDALKAAQTALDNASKRKGWS